MTDAYANFAELSAAHRKRADYAIICTPRTSPVCVIAPHAGKIEFQTGELARDIAGQSYGLYVFEGHLPRGNGKLHLTSTNFDEPEALGMIAKCKAVLALHGRRDEATVDGAPAHDPSTIFLGGLDSGLIAALAANLQNAGFATLDHGHAFPATYPNNICNRGTSGKGAQIELPTALRNILRDDLAQRARFVTAIQAALATYPK